MKHIFSRLMSCLLAVLVLGSLPALGASAATKDRLDPDKSCVLNMQLHRPGTKDPLVGAKMGLYRFAKIKWEPKHPDNQILYVQEPFYSDVRVQRAKLWKGVHTELEYRAKLPPYMLLDIVDTEKQKGGEKLQCYTAVSDQNGKVRFADPEIKSGLYFMILENAEELGCMMEPFLITLPRIVDGVHDYQCKNVTVEPKTDIGEAVVDILVKKVWKGDEDTVRNRPRYISVELMNGSQRADVADLSLATGWSHTFKNKPKNINWTVQERKVRGYKGEVGEMKWVRDHYEVTIINTKDGTLVQTGELKWPVPVLLVAGSLLMLGGFTLCQSRKKFEN